MCADKAEIARDPSPTKTDYSLCQEALSAVHIPLNTHAVGDKGIPIGIANLRPTEAELTRNISIGQCDALDNAFIQAEMPFDFSVARI